MDASDLQPEKNPQNHTSYEIVCVEWLGLSQIYYHKEPPGEIPPGNSRRCPQVTDTQGRRGTKYVLGASITSFCRSRKYFLFVSLQHLPASHAAVEVQF